MDQSIRGSTAYDAALHGMGALTILTFVATSIISAPYGRHVRAGWGPEIPARVGWIVMESPSLWMTSAVFFSGQHSANPWSRIVLSFFLGHYIHRVFIYPFRARMASRSMPVFVAALAFSYNCYNGYLQGYNLGEASQFNLGSVLSPRFFLGAAVFIGGFLINTISDSILVSLRQRATDTSYKIPRGFLFSFVSCPNYLGEIVEWAGWAIMTLSWPGLLFFLYTCANLIPRALDNQRWYKSKFEEYPPHRTAVIPYFL